MNHLLRCALVLSVSLTACAPEDEPVVVETSRDELSTNQALAAVFTSSVHAARARCLAHSLMLGALDTNQGQTIDTSLAVQPLQGLWLVTGCGAQAFVSRDATQDPRLALRAHLETAAVSARELEVGLARLPRSGDAPGVTFVPAAPRRMNFELPFDGYERADAVIRLTQLSLDDAAHALAPLSPQDFVQAPPRLVAAQVAWLTRLTADTVSLAEQTSASLAGPQQPQQP